MTHQGARVQMASTGPDAGPLDTNARLYLDLLAKCLTRDIFEERYVTLNETSGRINRSMAVLLRGILSGSISSSSRRYRSARGIVSTAAPGPRTQRR